MLLRTNGGKLWLPSTGLSLNSRIIIIIIIFRHESGLDRPVSAAPNPFRDLPSRLRPFGLQFRIVLATLLLFLLVTCCSQ